nr:hypothetical protein YSBCXYJI_YSBCXYJI_CDS_0107 [Caudoviricetes sp.]
MFVRHQKEEPSLRLSFLVHQNCYQEYVLMFHHKYSNVFVFHVFLFLKYYF